MSSLWGPWGACPILLLSSVLILRIVVQAGGVGLIHTRLFLQQTKSFTVDIRAKPEYHKFLIGKGGGKIRKVRDSTGARIIFPAAEDKDQDLITIIGKEDAVREAQRELEALIQNLVGNRISAVGFFDTLGMAPYPPFFSKCPRIMWLKTTCWWTPSTIAILSSEEARCCGRLLRSMVG